MRLSQKAVEEREQFVRSLFTTDQKVTMKAANQALFEKFGSRMRPHRVYAIRNAVRNPVAEAPAIEIVAQVDAVEILLVPAAPGTSEADKDSLTSVDL